MQGIKFNDKGLVPAIAQDINTNEVLMLAYMNEEALRLTLSSGKAHYYSRSRERLWLKGETSGNFQEVRSVYYDCDADTVLLLVEPLGPACHTGERTCFYRKLGGETAKPPGPRIIKELYHIVKGRKNASPDKSYVASLYAKGLEKILSKVEEESDELIEAARVKGRADVVYELCDLWFHSLVLLANQGIDVEEVFQELARRFGISGIEEKEARGRKE
ncbi:MAG: bifunctional phosphoribosyl-AMP cyclohydrolase/phosphoribosyl-ATP diphosphatase HisIE [Deltaproteobacteria bacterium]|nr:bifunctional phosphoribosyl-AMP cyclohydrolase/phosphoribosyl-ATP diphosphatase HisIE [Deltaproteobacteria bacterium]